MLSGEEVPGGFHRSVISQNPAPPDLGAVVDGAGEGVDAPGELVWVLPPLDPHAAAPTPSIATTAMGAARRRTLFRALVLVRFMFLILLCHSGEVFRHSGEVFREAIGSGSAPAPPDSGPAV